MTRDKSEYFCMAGYGFLILSIIGFINAWFSKSDYVLILAILSYILSVILFGIYNSKKLAKRIKNKNDKK